MLSQFYPNVIAIGSSVAAVGVSLGLITDVRRPSGAPASTVAGIQATSVTMIAWPVSSWRTYSNSMNAPSWVEAVGLA